MSSHHIVRENQEPALLVLDSTALDAEYFGQLLEWSPTIIASEQSLDFLLAQGIKVDLLLSASQRSDLQENTKQIPLDKGLLQDALLYLLEHAYKAVNIMCDRLPSNLSAFYDRLNMVFFVQGIRYVLVRGIFEKWKPAGQRMYIPVDRIKSFQGLKQVQGELFETLTDGFIRVEFNSPIYVCLGEDI